MRVSAASLAVAAVPLALGVVARLVAVAVLDPARRTTLLTTRHRPRQVNLNVIEAQVYPSCADRVCDALLLLLCASPPEAGTDSLRLTRQKQEVSECISREHFVIVI